MTDQQQARSTITSYPAGFDIRRPLKSFTLTVYEVLIHPKQFYSRLESERSEYPAMSFLYVLGAIAALVALLVELATGSTLFYVSFFGGNASDSPGFIVESAGAWQTLATIIGLSAVAPVLLIITNYLWAFIVHAVAWLYMGRRAGNVKHTFRVIAYSNAVGLVALALPFISFLATGWALVLLVVGVRRLNPRTASYSLRESGEASPGPPEEAPRGG